MKIGVRVKVKANASGSDIRYVGREGVVVEFSPTHKWTSPRALLCPNSFVCVHFLPVSAKDRRQGSPIDLMDEANLIITEPKSSEGEDQ